MLYSQSNRILKSIMLFLGLCLLQPVSYLSAKEAVCDHQGEIRVLGLVEFITIHSFNASPIHSKALLDTGATNSAIYAKNIYVQNAQRGESIVTFEVKDSQTGKWNTLRRPLSRYAWIKTHHGSPVKKVVVNLPIKVGKITGTSEFYLMDRQAFKHPVLLGRSFLKSRALVDVSRQHIANHTYCISITQR